MCCVLLTGWCCSRTRSTSCDRWPGRKCSFPHTTYTSSCAAAFPAAARCWPTESRSYAMQMILDVCMCVCTIMSGSSSSSSDSSSSCSSSSSGSSSSSSSSSSRSVCMCMYYIYCMYVCMYVCMSLCEERNAYYECMIMYVAVCMWDHTYIHTYINGCSILVCMYYLPWYLSPERGCGNPLVGIQGWGNIRCSGTFKAYNVKTCMYVCMYVLCMYVCMYVYFICMYVCK